MDCIWLVIGLKRRSSFWEMGAWKPKRSVSSLNTKTKYRLGEINWKNEMSLLGEFIFEVDKRIINCKVN